MAIQIYSSIENYGITRWYWNKETSEIIETFGTATMVIGYAKTETEAIEFVKA